jgi:hypothetical protein
MSFQDKTKHNKQTKHQKTKNKTQPWENSSLPEMLNIVLC